MVNGIYVDSRVTFTRAGTRTYYGQEVVKAEENLLLRSQDYTSTWTVTNLTPVTGKSAPDGTSTATEFTATAANAVLTQAITAVAGSYTFSVFLRRVTGTGDIEIAADNGTWTTKVITGTWARYDVTQTLTAGSKTAGIRVVTDTDAIEVWGAQLEFRSSLTAYTATTTQPITRYQRQLKTAAANEWPREFDPVTGECLGRSVWESRTNLLLYSEQFDDAYWTKTNATILANQIISPDGTLTADGIITTGAPTQLGRFINLTSGIPYTLSVFAKKNTSETLQLVIDIAGGAGLFSFFNLNTGTVTTTGAGVTRAAISDVGNGWYRCLVAATTTTVGNTPTIRGSGIYIWGAQLEAGAFATPYIPTVAAQVTRLADTAVMTGTNFSSWFNPSEGTLFVEFNRNIGFSPGPWGITRGASGTANSVAFLNASPADTRLRVRSHSPAGSLIGDIHPATTYPASAQLKTAFSYSPTEGALSHNGLISTSSSYRVEGVAVDIRIGSTAIATEREINGYIKRLTYYNQALTSANLQAVTR